MKKVKIRLLTLLLSMIIIVNFLSPKVFAIHSENIDIKDNKAVKSNILDSNVMTKQEMLSEAYQQLKDQGAERFYYIVERVISDNYRIENTKTQKAYLISESTRTSIRIPNGGTVYYPNYLGTRTKVTEIYMNKSDSTKYMNGSMIQDIVSYILNLIPGISTILSVLNFVNLQGNEQIRQARLGTGCIELFHSDDGDGSARLIFHWKTYPTIYVYSGYKLFRK
ncbi:MAG: hypothetical protein SPJ59_02785 [Peptoniphilaceae bacterium]|nr:hypothetical protein [Peptoniphilaceae bacterium]MDY5766378.1 hypothetical protein [Peptoniphilaceae bacterium]MDY5841844.1 hypothetical protein [Peptoniphilaceae bacterium]